MDMKFICFLMVLIFHCMYLANCKCKWKILDYNVKILCLNQQNILYPFLYPKLPLKPNQHPKVI